jgi:DNA-binding IclR family transcriptional regulator
VLKLLPKEGLTIHEWKNAAHDEHGASKSTFYRLKGELEQAGKVHKSTTSEKWQPVTKRP